jgi:hypothetical protein
MAIDKEKLKQQLIEIYEGYTKDINDNDTKEKAQKLFFEYVYTSSSLDREFLTAVNGLEHIGWEYSRSTKKEINWKMKVEEAIRILEKLKGL